jgi:hypothetical protein
MPPVTVPYAGRDYYRSPFVGGIASLIGQRADIQADATRRGGQLAGQTLANIGQTVAGGLEAYGQQRTQQADAQKVAAKEAALREVLSEYPPDPRKVLGVMGPVEGLKVLQGLKALEVDPAGDYDKSQKVLRDTFLGFAALPEGNRSEYYPQVRQSLIQRGVITPEDAPETYSPEWFTSITRYGQTPEKPSEGFTLGPGQQRFGPDGQPIASVAPMPEKPKSLEFGPAKPMLVDGKLRPVREGSDGRMYDDKAQVITGRIDLPPERVPAGPRPDYEWVVRDGNTLQIQKGTARKGDVPYDPVAARQGAGQQQGPSPYAAEMSQRINDSLTDLDGRVSNFTVGIGSRAAGSIFDYLVGGEATNFAADLEALKAQIAFSALQEMRDASKTGGALGAVSERELSLLESNLAGLSPKQTPANFKKNLKRIRESVARWNAAKAQTGTVVNVAKDPFANQGRDALLDELLGK